MSGYVGRLAPSPTGLLHLGHARTFSIAFERARRANGTLWLRDEDLDPQRSRADFAQAMREDLRWLGITWDDEMRQSERLPAYQSAMKQLFASGHVYACTCSRRDLLQTTQAPHDDAEDEPIYRGTCRPSDTSLQLLSLSEATRLRVSSRLEAKPEWRDPRILSERQLMLTGSNYRFRVPDGETIRFADQNAGAQAFRAGCDEQAGFGDFLVWRKDGLPSYQLACVVDDAEMSVTEVVRGRDLLKSTARQILLQRALGLTTPGYYHCDLMRDAAGVRLAKRHDALSLRAMREAGMAPEQIWALF